MDEKLIYELFGKRYIVLEEDEYNLRMKNAELVIRKKTTREILAMFDDKNIITWDDLKSEIERRYIAEVDNGQNTK